MKRVSILRPHRAVHALRGFALGGAVLVLCACGTVEVGTDMEFPKPLVEELPMTVGVYYSDEYRAYEHDESRWGVDWKIDLGQYHVRMGNRLFESTFRDTVPVEKLGELPADGSLRAVIEPRIEQYSFITPRDTGAKYYAVTIRYRLNVFAPDGRLADTLTFTGYGSAPSSGYSSTSPMIRATKSAMRDAAAKFLVQFPEQPIAKKMIAELPLIEAAAPAAASASAQPSATGSDVAIESVPIVDEAHPNASTPIRLPGSSAPPTLPSGQAPVPPATPPATGEPSSEPAAGEAPAVEPPSDTGTSTTESPPAAEPESGTQTSDTPDDPPPPKETAPPEPPASKPDPGSIEGPSRWTSAGAMSL